MRSVLCQTQRNINMHSQDTMDAILRKNKKPEIFPPKKRASYIKTIEEIFDIEFLVIVPLLSDNPTKGELTKWAMRKSREKYSLLRCYSSSE